MKKLLENHEDINLVGFHTKIALAAVKDGLKNVIVWLHMPGEFVDAKTSCWEDIQAYIPGEKFYVDTRGARHQE